MLNLIDCSIGMTRPEADEFLTLGGKGMSLFRDFISVYRNLPSR